MRLCVVFLAVLLTRGLASSPFRTGNENFGLLIDALLSVAENFSTCKTSESVLSVRDALVNQQEVVQRRCDAAEKLVKTSIDGVREDFVLRLSQEMETTNAQLLDLRKDNEALNKSVEKLQGIATDMAEKVQDLYASISSGQEDVNNTVSKGGFGCPSPFMPVESDCIYIHTLYEKNWDDARSICRQIGGDLAVPTDVIKLGAFLSTRSYYWIGATDREVEGVFRWVTGTKVDLSTGWGTGEPDDDHNGQDCVRYRGYDQLMEDSRCDGKDDFICQADRL